MSGDRIEIVDPATGRTIEDIGLLEAEVLHFLSASIVWGIDTGLLRALHEATRITVPELGSADCRA